MFRFFYGKRCHYLVINPTLGQIILCTRKSLTVGLGTLIAVVLGAAIVAIVGSSVALLYEEALISWARGISGALAVAGLVVVVIAGSIAVAGMAGEIFAEAVVVIGAFVGGTGGAFIRILVRVREVGDLCTSLT